MDVCMRQKEEFLKEIERRRADAIEKKEIIDEIGIRTSKILELATMVLKWSLKFGYYI